LARRRRGGVPRRVRAPVAVRAGVPPTVRRGGTSLTIRPPAPRSAAREKREDKAEAKFQKEVDKAAEGSLFPEWVREQMEEQHKQKKGRKR
jgi:hypothetical protein